MGKPAVADAVWVKNPDAKAGDVFVKGSVVAADGANVSVQLAGGGALKLDAADAFPANPEGMVTPDNTMLIHLSEPTILENVQQRFADKEIYTLTGSILLAMNPFQRLPIYTEEVMGQYKGKRLGAAAPHVYGIAEAAYTMLAKTGVSQAVVVSGETGAGKTETNKALMYYLAWRSKNSGGQRDLAEVILQSNPVLEAFGNAKTSRNNNSSRFGKFIKILIDKKGNIIGARMSQYLLEKSRVAAVGEGERNYHAFYHLAAGAPAPTRAKLGLDGGPSAFRLLSQSSALAIDGMDDGKYYAELTEALRACGIGEGQLGEMFALIAGVLHLGNVTFTDDDATSIASGGGAHMTDAFGTDVTPCLLARTMKVGTETTRVPLDMQNEQGRGERVAPHGDSSQ